MESMVGWETAASPLPTRTMPAGRSGQSEAEVAELFDRGDELVSGLEPDLLLLRVARDHALGRAGEDDVAGPQRHVVGNVAHQLLAVEHHVGRVRRLAPLAVDRELDLEVVAVGEVGGDE